MMSGNLITPKLKRELKNNIHPIKSMEEVKQTFSKRAEQYQSNLHQIFLKIASGIVSSIIITDPTKMNKNFALILR